MKKIFSLLIVCLTALTLSAQSAAKPITLYDYLEVFPYDLGYFESVPTTVIDNINKTQQYGNGTWRLPTKEELNLMQANNLISVDGYMASDGSHYGKVRLVTDRQKGEILRQELLKLKSGSLVTDKQTGEMLPAVPAGYVDLGLPSGTLWKDKNEGGFYTFEKAIKKFGNQLPTKEQLEELKSSCQWNWTGNGYKIVGPSGKSIILPAAGFCFCDGYVNEVGSIGRYWSSTLNGSDDPWYLHINSNVVVIGSVGRCGRSVRLVQ